MVPSVYLGTEVASHHLDCSMLIETPLPLSPAPCWAQCRCVARSVESILHYKSLLLRSVYGWLSLKYPFWSPLKDEIPCYFHRFSCLIFLPLWKNIKHSYF